MHLCRTNQCCAVDPDLYVFYLADPDPSSLCTDPDLDPDPDPFIKKQKE
jgi:hypothetical protein